MSNPILMNSWSVIRDALDCARDLEVDNPEKMRLDLDEIAAKAATSILDLLIKAGFDEGQA
jgi:hypothetical protein